VKRKKKAGVSCLRRQNIWNKISVELGECKIEGEKKQIEKKEIESQKSTGQRECEKLDCHNVGSI
jgi:hypothetical protein